jgi:hypothetical protein
VVTSNEQRLRDRDLILTSKPCLWLLYRLFANAILDRNAPCVHETMLRPPASTSESRHVRYLNRGCFPPSALACTAGTRWTQRSRRNQVTCAAARTVATNPSSKSRRAGAPNLVSRLPFRAPLSQIACAAGPNRRLRRVTGGHTRSQTHGRRSQNRNLAPRTQLACVRTDTKKFAEIAYRVRRTPLCSDRFHSIFAGRSRELVSINPSDDGVGGFLVSTTRRNTACARPSQTFQPDGGWFTAKPTALRAETTSNRNGPIVRPKSLRERLAAVAFDN